MSAAPPQPWMRYFARSIDSILAIVPTFLIIPIVSRREFERVLTDRIGAGIFMHALLYWLFLESLLLAVVGTTPGKALLNIHLRASDGSRMTLSRAFVRSLRVWFFGMGIGFPFAAPLANLAAYSRLRSAGVTSWDAEGHFVVTHGRVGAVRIVLTLGLLVLTILVIAVLRNLAITRISLAS